MISTKYIIYNNVLLQVDVLWQFYLVSCGELPDAAMAADITCAMCIDVFIDLSYGKTLFKTPPFGWFWADTILLD